MTKYKKEVSKLLNLDFFQTLYNDNSNPLVITTVDTMEIVFVNLAMQKLLKESGTILDCIKQPKCYEVLHNKEQPCDFVL